MRPDYSDLWLTSVEVPNESPKQWQANGKRGCTIYRIQQPQMLGVTGIIPAKFFAQDGVIRVSLGDASPQQLLSTSVRLRDFRSVDFVFHSHVFPERKNKLACFARQSSAKSRMSFRKTSAIVSIPSFIIQGAGAAGARAPSCLSTCSSHETAMSPGFLQDVPEHASRFSSA